MTDSEFYRTLLRAYIDSANDGIFVLCDEMKFHVANPVLQSWLGESEERLTEHGKRRPITEFIGDDETAALFAREFETVMSGQPVRFAICIRPGGPDARWIEISLSRVALDVGELFIGVARDISESKAAADRIESLAFFDPLTRLPNRRLLLDRLQHAVATSARTQGIGALLFIDLDDFKTLNDTQGHDLGDRLLEQVGARLEGCVRSGDTVARFGGDEFVVMLENLATDATDAATQAETVGEKILFVLQQPFELAERSYFSSASIGITLFSGDQHGPDELMKRADLAMYQAKSAGRNALRFFDPDMQQTVSARVALEADLREGLDSGQFLLHFQPQVDAAQGISGAEVLARWQHPRRGLVAPADFIPLAEETGLILPLGNWVLQEACNQLVAWGRRAATAHLTVAVNVSARQFRQADFVAQVLTVLDATGADPRKLKLELTESLLLHDVEDVVAKMTALKDRGVGFSLDDFGTGYSSLAYLKRLPLDQLKIDRSFVRDVMTDANDATIAHTIVALAHSFGLHVIAEGVENESQRDFLASHGCVAYQGYLFSRPLPLEDLDRLLEQG